MRVLITGAAGFIGSHLADRFRDSGHDVYGVDNLLTGDLSNWHGDNYRLIVGDIANRLTFYAAANAYKPELVVHCAASYSDPDRWHRDTDTNVMGAINVALVAQHHGARLVYFQTALPPVSSYAISKHAGQRYLELSDVPLLVFRLANIYGPRNISGPIPAFYKRLAAGDVCTVVNTRRDTVYVEDLLGLVCQGIDEKAVGCYDVCSGQHMPIRHYYDAVAAAMGETAEPLEVPAGADDVTEMSLDPAGALADFGWRSTTSLTDGVAETVASYRTHGLRSVYTHLRGV